MEVDPAVVNLTAFETFFEEKRPFFIEGANIFNNFGAAAQTTSGDSTAPSRSCSTPAASAGRRRAALKATSWSSPRRRRFSERRS